MSSLQGPPTGLAESPDSALRPAPSPAALRSLCALPRLAPGALLLSRRPFSPTPVKFSPAKLFCGGVPKSQTVVQRQVLRRLAPARFSDRFSGRLPLQQAGVRAGAEMGGLLSPPSAISLKSGTVWEPKFFSSTRAGRELGGG